MKSRTLTLLLALTTIGETALQAGDRVPVPPPTETALRYYHSGNVLWVIAVLWGFAVPLAIVASGIAAKMRDAAWRIGRRWFPALAIFTAMYLLVTFVIDLPFAWYAGFHRQHLFGLSNQTLAKWASDELKLLGVNLLVVPLVGWVPVQLLRRRPRSWWLWTALLTVPLIAATLLLTPLVFDPLFNDFHRLRDRTLEAKILQLADRAGVEGSRVYEVDKSVDTKLVNAYVTGFLSSKRIVLWDTTLQKLDEREILSVLGHELGHFVLGHVSQFISVGSLVALLALFLVDRSGRAALRRYGARIGAETMDDFAALPLLLLLFSLVMFGLTPALLALSRHNEHEADRFGLEITRDNHAAATSFVKMQYDGLAVPFPSRLYVFFRSSHPPIGERIEFCNDYRPWEVRKPLRYRRYIRR